MFEFIARWLTRKRKEPREGSFIEIGERQAAKGIDWGMLGAWDQVEDQVVILKDCPEHLLHKAHMQAELERLRIEYNVPPFDSGQIQLAVLFAERMIQTTRRTDYRDRHGKKDPHFLCRECGARVLNIKELGD